MAVKNPIPTVGLSNAHRHWKNRYITALIFLDNRSLDLSDPEIWKIEAYSEPGEMSPTIWFEVSFVKGKHERSRFNGSHLLSVHFREMRNDS